MEGIDESDKVLHFHVTYYKRIILLWSLCFYVIDIGVDFYLLYFFYTKKNYSYFWWTLAFIYIPIMIITFISVRMYLEDWENGLKKTQAFKRIIFSVIGIPVQLAPFIRYIDSYRFAIKSLHAEKDFNEQEQIRNFKKMLNEDSDVALLRVFECYLESSPQQVLQIIFLLIDYSYGSKTLQMPKYVMITLSFIAMGVCMATYNSCIRLNKNDKENISIPGIFAQFFWHLNITVSRILILAVLAYMNPLWACLAVMSHWIAMTIWLHITSRNDFCGNNTFLDILFSAAMGLIYIFNFIGLRDRPTRKFYIFFYSLCFLENLIVCIIWSINPFLPSKNWVYYFFLIAPIVTFLIGIICLLMYYKFLHPNKLTQSAEY